jgi:hypothetical protein
MGAGPRVRKSGVGERRNGIGDHKLFEQADRENGKADSNVARVPSIARHAPELRDGLRMVDDRAGNEMRKIGHEQKIFRRTQRGRGAAERVDEESDLRKRIEGNSDRQRNHRNGPLRAGQQIKVRHQEAGVLEVPQEG